VDTDAIPPTTPDGSEDQLTTTAVFSENVVAPAEPVVEEPDEPVAHRFGIRRAPERNVGG
jgi:hypothetical protein